MEEEVEMQRGWRDDVNKCTFIILARDLLAGADVDGAAAVLCGNAASNDDAGIEISPPPTIQTSKTFNSTNNDGECPLSQKKAYPKIGRAVLTCDDW